MIITDYFKELLQNVSKGTHRIPIHGNTLGVYETICGSFSMAARRDPIASAPIILELDDADNLWIPSVVMTCTEDGSIITSVLSDITGMILAFSNYPEPIKMAKGKAYMFKATKLISKKAEVRHSTYALDDYFNDFVKVVE